MLCEHGYTAFYDCPHCLCPGCGKAQAECSCHADDQRLQDLERAAKAAGEVA